MSKLLLGTVPLMNRTTEGFEDARLYRGIDHQNLMHVENNWKPMLQRLGSGAQAGNQPQDKEEDAHWEWGPKMQVAERNPLVHDIFALECANATQALMLVTKGGVDCFSRHPDHPRADIIYVEFVSTAPWNRKNLVANPIYKGGGLVMIATAVTLSLSEGMDGRIGLHSLPKAESFYRDVVGMTALGKDPSHQGMMYFELSSPEAAKFISAQIS